MTNRANWCCLNTATIRPLAISEAIRVTAQAGFGGIGLWIHDIDAWLNEGRSLSELEDTIDRAGLTVFEICFVGGWQVVRENSLDAVLSEAERIFTVAHQLECRCVVAVPSMTRSTNRCQSVTNFRQVCHIAAQYDVGVALEFVGAAEEIRTLSAAWGLVKEADCENGGLLLDTFHFHVGGSQPETILEVPPERIFLVHVSDAEDVPAETLRKPHDSRTFPGRGTIDYTPIFRHLRRIGYAGGYSMEIFNHRFLKEDAETIARQSCEAMNSLLEGNAQPIGRTRR